MQTDYTRKHSVPKVDASTNALPALTYARAPYWQVLFLFHEGAQRASLLNDILIAASVDVRGYLELLVAPLSSHLLDL